VVVTTPGREWHKFYTSISVKNKNGTEFLGLFSSIPQIPTNKFSEYMVDDILSEVLPSVRDHLIIFLGVEESSYHEVILKAVDRINLRCDKEIQQGTLKNYTIILNNNHNYKNLQIYHMLKNTLVIPWFSVLCKHYYENKFTWNSNARRVLFFPGKLYKKHRIVPIYDLFKKDLLCETLYSMQSQNFEKRSFNDNEWLSILLSFIKDYDESYNPSLAEFKEFIMNLSCDPDGSLEFCVENEAVRLKPISHKIYAESCVELISETWLYDCTHLTEKTYRAMHAGQPFIHVGSHFTDYLEKQGFRTFLKYTGQKISHNRFTNNEFYKCVKPEYENIEISDSIDSVHKFKDMCADPDIAKRIHEDIEFNWKKVNEIYDSTVEALEKNHPGFKSVSKQILTRLQSNEYITI
jgi:hypothetical protein